MRNLGLQLPPREELARDRPHDVVRNVFFFGVSFVATFLGALLVLYWLL